MSVWFMFISSRGVSLWSKKSQLNLPLWSARNHSDWPTNLRAEHRRSHGNWIRAVHLRHGYSISSLLHYYRCKYIKEATVNTKKTFHIFGQKSDTHLKTSNANTFHILGHTADTFVCVSSWHFQELKWNPLCIHIWIIMYPYDRCRSKETRFLPTSTLHTQDVICCCYVFPVMPPTVAIVTVK